MGNAGEGGIAVAEGWWERNFNNYLAALVFIFFFVVRWWPHIGHWAGRRGWDERSSMCLRGFSAPG